MATRDKNQEVASALTTAVNCYFDAHKAAEYMTREHRTLQQTFTRVCVEWLLVLSKQEYYDDRNADSVRLAKALFDLPEVRDIINNTSLPLI